MITARKAVACKSDEVLQLENILTSDILWDVAMSAVAMIDIKRASQLERLYSEVCTLETVMMRRAPWLSVFRRIPGSPELELFRQLELARTAERITRRGWLQAIGQVREWTLVWARLALVWVPRWMVVSMLVQLLVQEWKGQVSGEEFVEVQDQLDQVLKLEWLWEENLAGKLREQLNVELGKQLELTLGTQLGQSLGVRLGKQLEAKLGECLGDHLGKELEEQFVLELMLQRHREQLEPWKVMLELMFQRTRWQKLVSRRQTRVKKEQLWQVCEPKPLMSQKALVEVLQLGLIGQLEPGWYGECRDLMVVADDPGHDGKWAKWLIGNLGRIVVHEVKQEPLLGCSFSGLFELPASFSALSQINANTPGVAIGTFKALDGYMKGMVEQHVERVPLARDALRAEILDGMTTTWQLMSPQFQHT